MWMMCSGIQVYELLSLIVETGVFSVARISLNTKKEFFPPTKICIIFYCILDVKKL